ncbi:hypothetical protein [Prochlorococcus marinus]|uniref:Uncharacterized protein n=1 Tax=Prochlorococcus marinus str. PAC1 TaxID=59924 RepID=A0A0A2C0U9_PROMR|nr:hypothetical protein [Prochlorococcus marinus]KGG19976.1 hypothetical protein EV03_1440 [Prochlorococcus marinus str. PAC1]
MSFKTSRVLTGLLSALFLSFIPSAPMRAEWLTETGTGLNGGRSYNLGEYEDANELDQNPFSSNTIQDQDGNLYDQDVFGTYNLRN